MVYPLTVAPISSIKEMKFVDMGHARELYDLSLGKDVVMARAP